MPRENVKTSSVFQTSFLEAMLGELGRLSCLEPRDGSLSSTFRRRTFRIVSGKVHTGHVARLRFYADADLNITAEIKDVVQHSYAQGECRMNALMHVTEDDQGDVIVLVDWEGFDAEERKWESLRKIHSSASDFVLKELRKLRLTRALKGKLASECGISL